MASLLELRKQNHAALTKADALVTAAENAKRNLTATEVLAVDTALTEARELAPKIATMERRETLQDLGPIVYPTALATRKRLSASYPGAFASYFRTGGAGGTQAAMYEGADDAGGFAVPSTVFGQVLQLAPADAAIRRLATVIATDQDIKFPVASAAGTAALKPESGASANAFAGTDPALAPFKLSAFAAGVSHTVSFELFHDVPTFTTFLGQDGALALTTLEEGLFVGGSGNGEAQGLIGNVGAGVTEEPDTAGNLVTINGTYDILGTLKEVYHANASWLMQRSTAIALRKAQAQANLFEPVFSRSGGHDYLHGYPIAYSAAMPAAARGAAPILFGDFAFGYLIGDRGGPGVNLKIVDQTLAYLGLVDILLYRRTDGRVRRAEAIQQYNVAAS